MRKQDTTKSQSNQSSFKKEFTIVILKKMKLRKKIINRTYKTSFLAYLSLKIDLKSTFLYLLRKTFFKFLLKNKNCYFNKS